MLPVSAWPPGPPGSSLSPFGPPRDVCIPACGFVLPKGAWIVQTGANQVVMFRPDWRRALYDQPRQQMGTGYLPGQWQWRHGRPAPLVRGQGGRPIPEVTTVSPYVPTPVVGPITNAVAAAQERAQRAVSRETQFRRPPPQTRPTHNQALEAWRAWQRRTGNTDPPIRPIPGRVPPNFAGWRFVGAPAATLIPFASAGTVLADGQNVVIQGAGFANITQAYSV